MLLTRHVKNCAMYFVPRPTSVLHASDFLAESSSGVRI